MKSLGMPPACAVTYTSSTTDSLQSFKGRDPKRLLEEAWRTQKVPLPGLLANIQPVPQRDDICQPYLAEMNCIVLHGIASFQGN